MRRVPGWAVALPFLGLALVLLAHYAANSSLAMAMRIAGIALCIAYFAIRASNRKQ